MGKTFKDGERRERDKRLRRVRRNGYLFPDSDLGEIDYRDDRELEQVLFPDSDLEFLNEISQ